MSENCPFCDETETLVHCYLDCHRLGVLFHIKKAVLLNGGEVWSEVAFILGAGDDKEHSKKWCLLNFVVGHAKMAVYKSRIPDIMGGFPALWGSRVRGRPLRSGLRSPSDLWSRAF